MPEWQDKCSQAFTEVLDDPNLSHPQKVERWAAVKLALQDDSRTAVANSEERRVILADLHLQGRDLSGLDLSRVFFARVRFDKAELKNTMFMQSIFDDCSFAYANIQGANFFHADLLGSSMFKVDKFWLGTNLDTNSGIDTTKNRARYALVEAAREQQRRADLQHTEPSRLLRWWDRQTNFGSDFTPLLLLFLGGNALFGGIYYAVQRCTPKAFDPVGSYTLLDTLAMALLRSITTSAIAEPVPTWLAYVCFANGLFGILALGLFVAQITKYFLRSS